MAKKKAAKRKPLTFEQSLERLEEIVAGLEGGRLPLADSLQKYEEGVSHLKACYEQLELAERRIEKVSGVDKDGRPVTEPFADDGDAPLERKSAARSRRRSAPDANESQDSELF
ncbi:MAG: exodeoxyribonuclease VII small subunit [Planctomycetota bacterium]